MNVFLQLDFEILEGNNSSSSLVVQSVKNLPTMWETRVWSLGQEDPLEKGRATHSSILSWEIPWTEEPWRAIAHGVGHSWATNAFIFISKDSVHAASFSRNQNFIRSGIHTHTHFLDSLVVKNLPAKAGDMDLIPQSGRSPGEGNATHSSILA